MARRTISTLTFLPLFFAAGAASAELPDHRPEEFGTKDSNILVLSAAAFSRAGCSAGTLGFDPTSGFFVWGGTNTCTLFASVALPSGARVASLGLSFWDEDADVDVTATLRGYEDVSSPTASFDVGSVSSSGEAGFAYVSTALPTATPHTIDNDIAAGGAAYALLVDPGAGGNVGFKAVEIRWTRQVSPAPPNATFGDVPTSHLYFRAVEALATSGITAGCGSGNFCPEGNVTRGELAAFLSRALGLHWPN